MVLRYATTKQSTTKPQLFAALNVIHIMKSLLIIIAGIAASWHFTDIESESMFSGVLAPIGVGIFLASFLVWVVMFLHGRGIGQTISHNGDSGGFGGFGDGGGGDC